MNNQFPIENHRRRRRPKVWQLSVGEQQRVEILKMLYRGVQVLIMDEPTAVLAPQEIEGLIKTLRTMVAEGKSIVFISHKLNEVMNVADRVTVLRQGKVTAAGLPVANTSIPELARLMVGRSVIFDFHKQPQAPGATVLRLDKVSANNNKGLPALKNVSLTVRAGEIVGVAGVAAKAPGSGAPGAANGGTLAVTGGSPPPGANSEKSPSRRHSSVPTAFAFVSRLARPPAIQARI